MSFLYVAMVSQTNKVFSEYAMKLCMGIVLDIIRYMYG